MVCIRKLPIPSASAVSIILCEMPQHQTFCDAACTPRFPRAIEIPFGTFNNKYQGQSCYVVGRGPTEFDYEKFAETSDPIFFINDAVSLEKYARSETYFFAHDPQLLPWLNGAIKSTAVLPIDGKVFREMPNITLQHAGNLVFYHWREENKEDLLSMTRDELAQIKQLYTHTGTIHSVLHFIWFCGFKQVKFIGCDGIMAVDYDPRLENLSRSQPIGNYRTIAKAQQLLTHLFGLEASYLGTPTIKS
jgi:hypothetical protein